MKPTAYTRLLLAERRKNQISWMWRKFWAVFTLFCASILLIGAILLLYQRLAAY